jgi:hypothetical protein
MARPTSQDPTAPPPVVDRPAPARRHRGVHGRARRRRAQPRSPRFRVNSTGCAPSAASAPEKPRDRDPVEAPQWLVSQALARCFVEVLRLRSRVAPRNHRPTLSAPTPTGSCGCSRSSTPKNSPPPSRWRTPTRALPTPTALALPLEGTPAPAWTSIGPTATTLPRTGSPPRWRSSSACCGRPTSPSA